MTENDYPPLFRGIIYRVTDTPVIANVASVHSDRFLHLATCFTMRNDPGVPVPDEEVDRLWEEAIARDQATVGLAYDWPTAARSGGVRTASSNTSRATRRPPPVLRPRPAPRRKIRRAAYPNCTPAACAAATTPDSDRGLSSERPRPAFLRSMRADQHRDHLRASDKSGRTLDNG